ncbi:MAG: YigZ family protein [Candidatus Zixiibacteriota bacterium]|nr:MAG: YigZ family protein [candidate division Zixibacteria bacterium]
MDDRYFTIAQRSQQEIKVKGSRFIARTIPAGSVRDAEEQLAGIRRLEYAATHNCFAYVVGVPVVKADFKYSDDGEPNGTAGRPIYDVIAGSGVTNVLLVVTRYFGGTKLGTGGLAKAYGEAAGLAMHHSGVRENFITERLQVEVAFPVYDSLVKTIHRFGASQAQTDFTDRVSLLLDIRQSRTEQLIAEILELSKGKAKIEKVS